MTKLLKISGRTLWVLFEWLVILVIFFAFAIRSTRVQTYIAQKTANYLSKELNAQISIDQVSIVFVDRVALDNFLMLDQDGDTLFAAETVYATIDKYDLSKQEYNIKKVFIEGGYGHIQKDNEGVMNLQFLKDYFASDKPKKNKNLTFNVEEVGLSNCTFRYDDHRKTPIEKGVDYFHLFASNINGSIDDITLSKHIITGDVKGLSADEHSGFSLKELNAHSKISRDGVYLTDLNIATEKSLITSSKFNMITDHFDDFQHFVDSVQFDAVIDKSSVSMEDVAYFGHPLYGMNDMVTLKANINQTVNDLKISNLDLRFKDKTRILGTLNLPNFKKLEDAIVTEKLTYAYIDLNELQQLKLPNSSPTPFISLTPEIERLKYADAKNLIVKYAKEDFSVMLYDFKTELGGVKLTKEVLFAKADDGGSYRFSQVDSGENGISVDQFNLGAFLNNPTLGIVSGQFFTAGEVFGTNDIRFTQIDGYVDQFEFQNYAYSNISIDNASFVNNQLEGSIDINDPNLKLAYDGKVNLNGNTSLDFTVKVKDAALNYLGFTSVPARLDSAFLIVQLTGDQPNNFDGTILSKGFVYTEDGKQIQIDNLALKIDRGENKDIFRLNSPTIGSAEIIGKIDFNHLLSDLNYQFSRVFPAIYSSDPDPARDHVKDFFTYEINVINIDEVLSIFTPDLCIAQNTQAKGGYTGIDSYFTMNLTSDEVEYKRMLFSGLNLNQILDSNGVNVNYHVNGFKYNDALTFNDLFFTSDGGKNNLNSEFSWDGENPLKASSIHWETHLKDISHIDFVLDTSYFSIQSKRWEIANVANISIIGDTVEVADFVLKRAEQYLKIDGSISSQDQHQMNFDVGNLDLAEITSIFTNEYDFSGTVNAWGYISNPYTNLSFIGDAHVVKPTLNKEEIGDIFIQSEWNNKKESIEMTGDLIYKGNQTINFLGDYFVHRKKDNLDFSLVFDQTDIQFTNAFLDPDVVSDIRGYLNGKLSLKGTPSAPNLRGSIDLDAASANIGILGAHFGLDGAIEVDKYGFYINSIPVFDEDGNAGSLIGSVYHNDFKDFNFDLLFDLEDDAINKDPLEPWKVLPLERFLVMNSKYSVDDVYYGKAYATGIVNIFGYTDNLEIDVSLTSEKGTKVNFPMYGVSEIDENESFIDFVDHEDISDYIEPKIDFTGVSMSLDLNITRDAEIQLIFNEDLGDIITAEGEGNIVIDLDNLGDIQMRGKYTIDNGEYNFAMEPVKQSFALKQKFYIEKGGSVTWTGSPYNAQIDLTTFYKVNANMSELQSSRLEGENSAHEEIFCYLNLNETLLKPSIDFDIQAPGANDEGKSLLNRVKSDVDELNRQFFSLLLWKRFQPLTGTGGTDGSAALDLVANQINALLSKVSSDYNLNVALDNDQITGDNTFEVGLKKGFLDDRLIISGSFGVENQHSETDGDQSSIIGDVNLEYLLNESGTFRVNIFNESNDKTIIQDEKRGDFTQGAGLHYQEDFNTFKDFKAIQYFLDIFRKNKRYPIKRKRRQSRVPTEGTLENDTKDTEIDSKNGGQKEGN